MKRIGLATVVLLATLFSAGAFQVGGAGGLRAPSSRASAAAVLSLRGGFGRRKQQESGGGSSKGAANPGISSSAMLGSVGGMSSKGGSGSMRAKVELGLLIFLWYATSVVCTNSTKGLGLHWSVVTFAQLLISSMCGFIGIPVLGLVKYQPIKSRDQLMQTSLLASVFTLGFITLNWALGMMHVSLVMTLRATEPIFTLLLSAFLLKSEQVSWGMAASLMPVIAGAALSSAESSDFRLFGLAISIVCNVMFSLRGILTKRLKASHSVDNFNLFFQVCSIGTALQGALLLVSSFFTPVDLQLTRLVTDSSYASMLLVNGVTFFAYLQLSWVVLSRVAAVTHSVCNSLRRPVMCVFGFLQFGNYISPLNSAGIAMASLGTLFYAQVRIGGGESAE